MPQNSNSVYSGILNWANKLSVVIPVYNEKETIAEILERVRQASVNGLKKEIVIVDDASTDGTREWLAKLTEEGVRCFFTRETRGRGLHSGRDLPRPRETSSSFRMLISNTTPWTIRNSSLPILNGNADVVFGSRFLSGEEHRVLYFWHSLGNKVLTFMSNMFTNLNLTDMECGYKVFGRNVLQRISVEETRFGILSLRVSRRWHGNGFELGS